MNDECASAAIAGQREELRAGAITAFAIERRISPAFGGRNYGSAGQYEVLFGTITGTLRPDARENGAILDLDTAPVGEDGLVHYRTEVAILCPVDKARCSGYLLYEVLNRGNGMIDSAGQSTEGALSMLDLLMARGDIVVAPAWQADLARPVVKVDAPMLIGTTYSGSTLYADLPKAEVDGKPVVRRIRHEVSCFDAVGERPADEIALLYPAAPGASIAVYARRHESDAPVALPRADVWLRDERTIGLKPHEGAQIYDVIYDATGAFVSGIGLAIPRDVIAWLRSDANAPGMAANPLLGADGRSVVTRTCGYGISQSGRYLREFLWRGFNCGADGRQVFDGVMTVLAGGKKGFFNGLFARPALIPGAQEGHRHLDLYPFAYGVTTDRLSGRTDGILKACLATGSVPKIMHIDTETEVVEGFGWMLTTGPDGAAIPQPETVRLYSVAGADHGRGGWRRGMSFCRPAMPSPVPVVPFIRALTAAMREWLMAEKAPPRSCYPSLDNGGLVSMEEAQAHWAALSDHPFDAVRNPAEAWVAGDPLPVSRGRYPLLTPRVDTDGNTVVGIQHPMFAVPVGTLRGITPRAEGHAPQDLCPLQGEIIPFARTRDERLARGDHRLSLEERYPGGDEEIAARRRAVAAELVAAGYLLAAEAEAAAAGSVAEAYEALAALS